MTQQVTSAYRTQLTEWVEKRKELLATQLEIKKELAEVNRNIELLRREVCLPTGKKYMQVYQIIVSEREYTRKSLAIDVYGKDTRHHRYSVTRSVTVLKQKGLLEKDFRLDEKVGRSKLIK